MILYDFITFQNNHFTVQLNENTQTLFAEVDQPPGGPIEQQVTQNELGPNHPIGGILISHCQGSTLVQVLISDYYPFAKFNRILNAPSCGYNPGEVCDFTLFDILSAPETEAGLHNGVITVNAALTGQVLQYSLDNVNWQMGNVFKNLLPGIYTVYIKSTTTSCEQHRKIGVGAGPVVPQIPYPWQEKVCKFFKLIDGMDEYMIDEPLSWDQVEFNAKRTKDYHGWSSQYSDGSVQLGFACAAGKEVLETAYNLNGGDANVRFQYGFTYLDQTQVLFDGKINFNTYNKLSGYITAVIEGAEFNNLFTTRMDTKVNLSDGKTQDGDFIAVPKVYKVGLHGKAISTKFQVNSVTLWDYPVFQFREASSYIIPDTSEAKLTEITENFTYGLLIQNEAPYDIDLYSLNLSFGGVYNFDVAFSIDVKLKGRQGNQGSYTLTPMFMINDTLYPAGAVKQGQSSATDWQQIPVDFHYTGTHTLVAGDKVYWFIKMDTVGFIEGPSLLQKMVNITVEALEEAKGSDCRGWLLHDVIDYVAKNITNNHTFLKSNFLSLKSSSQVSDGQGSLYILTNGKQIRNFDVATNPLLISMNDCLKIVRSLFCCGYGFERIGGNEFLRIERVNQFYQNKKITQIDDVFEYSEEIAKDLIFNETEFGFEKYQSSGLNSLDEFNTRREDLMPIKTHKDKLIVKSPAIGSGYSIEKCRRNQYSETPTNSVDNDEDAFIISVNRTAEPGRFQAEKNEAFDIVENLISPETAYNLRLSPKRIELNWAIWVKNILYWKQPVDFIKTSFVDQNGLLRTKLKPSDLRAVGDIFKDDWVEKDDIQLSNYPVEEQIFKPEYMNIKAKITPNIMIMIDNAMHGQQSTPQNYGWIAVRDNVGLYQAGFPIEMKYNFFTKHVTMKLLKFYASPVNPADECCNYVTINGCRIIINGFKWRI